MAKDPADRKHLNVAVIGGTGNLGYGIALRLAAKGHCIHIGSRDEAKSETAAAGIREVVEDARVSGANRNEAARRADIVFIAVPFAAQRETLEAIRADVAGKIVVDTTVPLVPPRIRSVQLPASGSAAMAAREILGEGVRLVSAFQNVSAVHLRDPVGPVHCDVLVTGDDQDARQAVIDLTADMGMRGVHAGPLANAVAAESLTPLLLFINKHYGKPSAGIEVTNWC